LGTGIFGLVKKPMASIIFMIELISFEKGKFNELRLAGFGRRAAAPWWPMEVDEKHF
jgi:hypothetical protein